MSFNPNSRSFVPSGGAPPFQPGQPFYGQSQQPQQGQGQSYYDQYNTQQQPGAYYQQYNNNPYGAGAYGQANPYSAGNNPYAAAPPPPPQHYQQQQQYRQPEPETIAYQPPVRTKPQAPPVAFSRAQDDPSAPAPAKPPTVSLKIGGGAPASKPATVSLKIGSSAAQSKDAPPAAAAAAKKQQQQQPATGATPAAAAGKTESKTVASTSSAAAAGDASTAKSSAASGAQTPKNNASGTSTPKEEPAAANKTSEVLAEVQASVDEETLADLYGAGDVKSHLNIVFIGHVDAGKSTMGGNILYLCGMVDKRTMEKYEKEAKEAGRESWYLSWALDSTSQEREKGKTVEVGRAYFETDKRRYTILDAPGHKNFVPSMISGAAQADVAVLVISARKGEFETGFEKGGQTREHAMLVKTAGVSKLIVCVNKMDDPTVQWDKARYDEIHAKLSPFLKGLGFNLKTDVHFIPVSGFTGANLKDDVDRKVASWVEGRSLLNFLDELPMTDRKNNAPLMMPISEKYSDMGTVVVGKVESGHLRKGQNLLLMPNKNQVSVSAIYNEMEEEINHALCGDNVRVRLRGVEDEDILVGFVLTSVNAPVHAVKQFEAQLVILDHKNIITAGYSAVMHVHTLSEEVVLSALLHYYDKKTGRKSRRPPQFAKKGQKVIALLETTASICLEKFSDHPQLGRFTLRDEGKTIAIGKVVKLIESADDLPDVAKLSMSEA